MDSKYIIVVLVSLFTLFQRSLPLTHSSPADGALIVSPLALDKVIRHHKYVLTRFDRERPIDTKFNMFKSLVLELNDTPLLMAEARVVTKMNLDTELADRFHLKTSDFPSYILFRHGFADEPLRYHGDTLKMDELKKFLIENTDLSIPLDGCLPELDEVAHHFLSSEEHLSLLSRLEEFDPNIKENKTEAATSANIYIKIARRILVEDKDAPKFLQNEKSRLMKLLEGSLSPNKREAIKRQLNIVTQFCSNWKVQQHILKKRHF